MWYKLSNETEIITPAVLLFPDRIEANIRRMIEIAGDPSRLRPHVKTHKIAEVVQLQVEHKIKKFKCATLSEVAMVAAADGGEDILLAYPLLGPAVGHFFDIIAEFPKKRFSVTVDSIYAVAQLSRAAEKRDQVLDIFVDLDNGMHRTGIKTKEALDLVKNIVENPWLHFRGFHVYDGHIHESDIKLRTEHCDKDFKAVLELIQNLKTSDIEVEELACGGTFTFPIHAKHPSRTLCPGTPLLWDAGYEENIPDLKFDHAAVIATRVISKPNNLYCLDLGHKSIASEMRHPRVQFLNLEVDQVINHSEEHLVVSSPNPDALSIGDMVYAIPIHICPTMALHEQVYAVRNNQAVEKWDVVARKRMY